MAVAASEVCVGLGLVVARPYLMHPAKPAASLAPLDPKAQQLLSDGERAFADGNLDAAKEDFDKASVLADKDPHFNRVNFCSVIRGSAWRG